MVQDVKTTYLIPDVDTLWRGGLGSFAVTASAIAHQDKATQAAIRGSSERTATAYKPPAGLKLPVAFKIGAPRISITCCWGGSTAGPSHYRTYVARVVWFGLANAEDKTKTAEAPPCRNAWGCLVVHSRKFFSARAPSRLATWWSPPIRRSSVPCPRRPLSRSDNGSPHKSWLAKPRPYSPGFASTCG